MVSLHIHVVNNSHVWRSCLVLSCRRASSHSRRRRSSTKVSHCVRCGAFVHETSDALKSDDMYEKSIQADIKYEAVHIRHFTSETATNTGDRSSGIHKVYMTILFHFSTNSPYILHGVTISPHTPHFFMEKWRKI